MQCPNCGEPDTVRAWQGRVERYGIELAAHGRRCRSCGELLFDLAEMRRQERAIAKALAARGVRTGLEFKLVRKAAGLRAIEVAAMLDVTPETVSRWERGAVEVPRAAAYVLGDLLAHPKRARARLGSFGRRAVVGLRRAAPRPGTAARVAPRRRQAT